MNPAKLLRELPEFRHKITLVSEDQTTSDIINELLRKHKETASHYDAIAQHFAGGNVEKKLFDFCMSNLPYYVEPAGEQTTQTPAGILEIGTMRGVDCKHYSSFIAGVLDSLNRSGDSKKIVYRFADYDGNGKKHVFVVVSKKDGSEIWIDPTPIVDDSGNFIKRSFNDRLAIPVKYIDKNLPKMSLVTMNGFSPYGGKVGVIANTQQPAPATNTTTTSTSLTQAAATDPQVGAFVQSAMNIIDQLPDGGIKNFLKDYLKNPVTAFQRLYFGKPFTSGAYHLGEVFMRAILGDSSIQSRGSVPDAVVPQACEFFTVALGVRVLSEDHIEQLAISPEAYYSWMKQDAADVPRANVDRAHQILVSIDYPKNQSDGRRNNKWPLSWFEKIPYSYPLVGTTVNTLYNGTNPVNNIKIVEGYPATTATVPDPQINPTTGLPLQPGEPGYRPPGTVNTGLYDNSHITRGLLLVAGVFLVYKLVTNKKRK